MKRSNARFHIRVTPSKKGGQASGGSVANDREQVSEANKTGGQQTHGGDRQPGNELLGGAAVLLLSWHLSDALQLRARRSSPITKRAIKCLDCLARTHVELGVTGFVKCT